MIHSLDAEENHADAPGQRLEPNAQRSAVRSEVDCPDCAAGLHADEVAAEYRAAHAAGEHITSHAGCPTCMGWS